MPICIICGTPNPEEKELRYFDLPTSTSHPEWHARFMNELGIIGESDQQLRNMQICENHFDAEDIIENETCRLRENALPINNLIDSFDHYYVRPELVYVNTEVNEVEKDGETKNFTNLNPLVVYTYNNEGSEPEQEIDDCPEYMCENVETEIIEQDEEINPKSQNTNENSEDLSNGITGGDNGQFVEPMMPFFLSDPSVFTIMNENNEVGETIIVQIENDSHEETNPEDYRGAEESAVVEKDRKPLKNFHGQFTLPTLERTLCSSEDKNFCSTYICDICENSYGCMKCLKSHYESLHVSHLRIVKYKCENSPNCPKGLFCPVCELVFDNRTDTLDHYVTHYVACDICCSAFDRHVYLTEHMKTEHQKVDQNAEYECELCRNTYQYPSYLSKHYQIYHKMIICLTCKIRFKTVQELHAHEKIHIPKLDVLPYACSRCDKAFPKISDITVHIRAVHKQTPSETFVQSLGNRQFLGHVVENVPNSEQNSSNSKQNPTKKVKLKK